MSARLVEHDLAARDRVLAVVDELAPPTRSFVFTNVLVEDPEDIDRRALLERADLPHGPVDPSSPSASTAMSRLVGRFK